MQRVEEKNIVGKAADVIKVFLWSELCSDLLGDIMGRLCVTDQARFHAVCKSWRNVYPINKSHAWRLKRTSILSWFVRLDRRSRKPTSTLQLRLYEPCHSIYNPVSVDTISLSELGIPVPSSWEEIRIFCKYNWVFISVTEIKKFHRAKADIHFILFSPLTKTLKQLPPCSICYALNFEQSISSDPESADCVFLLLDTETFDDEICVSTYRRDDEEWTVRRFPKPENFELCRCIPMYDRRIYYIVSPVGQLATYDLNNKEINFVRLSTDDELHENYRSVWSRYKLFMVNGELRFNLGHKAKTRTKRFDLSNKIWIPVRRLQDSAIVKVEKPHSVENMIEFFCSGCLISSSESFNMDRFMRQVPKFVYDPGSRYDYGSTAFFWLKPPLIQ